MGVDRHVVGMDWQLDRSALGDDAARKVRSLTLRNLGRLGILYRDRRPQVKEATSFAGVASAFDLAVADIDGRVALAPTGGYPRWDNWNQFLHAAARWSQDGSWALWMVDDDPAPRCTYVFDGRGRTAWAPPVTFRRDLDAVRSAAMKAVAADRRAPEEARAWATLSGC